MITVGVHGHGDFGRDGAGSLKAAHAITHLVVGHLFAFRAAEAFLEDRYLGTPNTLPDGADIVLRPGFVLPWVETVLAGDRFEQQRDIGDTVGHRAAMVDCYFDGEDPGVGHQTVGRF